MFLYSLNADEQRAFLTLAHVLMHADGRESHEETLMLDLLCREMGIDRPTSLEDAGLIDEQGVLGQFTDAKSQGAVLLELILLSHSDGEAHEAEQAVVSRAAEAFGLNLHLEPMRNWALRQVALIQEASRLLSDVSA